MHELSIAQSIIESAESQARNHHSQCIEEIELEIGSLAGIEWKLLKFALESCIKGTLLESTRIVRKEISGEGRCGDCETVVPADTLFTPCPICGSYIVKIIKGKELRIKSIVVK